MKMSRQSRQVSMLYVSSIIGLLAGVLASVINTRALPPEAFGDVRYVQNIISFVSSLLLFGYFVSGSRLLAISKNEGYSRKLRGTLCIILLLSIIVIMIVMSVMAVYNHIQGNGISALFLASIPVCGNVVMLNYLNTVLQGDNHIGRISLGTFLPTLLYCLVAFVIFRIFSASSVLMLLLSNGIPVIILSIIILSTKPDFSDLKATFYDLHQENKAYGFDVYIGSMIGVSTGYLYGITLGWFCDTNVEVGFYTLAFTMAAPLSMLPSIIGTTSFKRFAQQDYIEQKVLISSIALTFASLIIFCLCIKYVVDFLYDDSYSSVSRYSAYLAIGTSMHGFGDLINRFLGAHGQGKSIRRSAMISGFVTLAGSIILVYFWNINGAIISKILSSFAYLATMIYYYLKYINKPVKN